ncbi:MAG: hypothetical protein V7K94_30310 [Nostoc sp.]|uniref:hypothetical protein n=1 Tax=Nostoc sp. TaxID=1180 RepID=UPI002FF6C425
MVVFGKTNAFWSEANHSRNELTQIIHANGHQEGRRWRSHRCSSDSVGNGGGNVSVELQM